MTLTEIRDALIHVAIDFRQRGQNCCAQLAEQQVIRLDEAIRSCAS